MYTIYHAYERPPTAQSHDPDALERELTDEELYNAENGHPWCPEPELFEDFTFLEEGQKQVVEIPAVLPSQFTEFAFRMPRSDGMGYEAFSFESRGHMRRIYDTPAKRILLFCGRQVEKSCGVNTYIMMADGSLRCAGDIRVGDEVASMRIDSDTAMAVGRVSWVSRRYTKPCVRVRTRQGHTTTVAKTHPLRQLGRWVPAGDLAVGHRLAVVRQAGAFFDETVQPERVRLTAYMLGDGGMSQPGLRFTSVPGAKLDEFVLDVAAIGGSTRLRDTKGRAKDAYIRKCLLHSWLRDDGLLGSKSATKFVPPWVFRLSRVQTCLFLNRLWSTDGHVKQNSRTKYSIEYSSISLRLIKEVQALLWKLGIPSCIRENLPSLYKKRGEFERVAYILRVETQEGLRRFLLEVGALGKSENVSIPEGPANNNRDTYPSEINELLRELVATCSRLPVQRKGGMRKTLKYPPTRDKLIQYYNFFASDPAVDRALLEKLAEHIETDLYWDVIERIDDVGVQECVDFSVEVHHSFVADGFITHNSTALGNRLITYSCMVPAFRTLYVSPSATQTKTFSVDRVKEPLETSDVLKAFTTTLLQQNVFEKQFINRAKITLRYAFLNADRCAVAETRVHFVDGSVATLGEMYRAGTEYLGRWVWAADPEGLQAVPAQVTAVLNQGVRPVLRVRVEGGAEVVCTATQPLLTWEGWKPVGDLAIGSFVAVPGHTAHGVGNAIPIAEYRLVGYLLGDGTTTTFNGVAFFSGSARVMADFRRCARTLGAKLGRLTDSNRKKWVHSKTRRQGIYGGTHGYKQRLRELGLVGKNHSTKRVPAEFFTGNEEQIANFLSAIYATDGWASVMGGPRPQYEIGYCSNSRGLLVDLQTLLLRFGIHGVISRRKKPSTVGARGAFVLSIREAQSALRFCERMHVLGKEAAHRRVYRFAKRVGSRDSHDRVPLSYASLRAYLKLTYGLSTHAAWVQHRIQLRPGNDKSSVGRRVLAAIAEKLGDNHLAAIASSGLRWVRIVSVTPEGEKATFDLTVADKENYLVDGLFIHNCRGIPAWCLAIDELQDILADNIPVIEQSLSHAPEEWRRFLYAGTPKGLDNTIEYYRSGTSKGQPMSTMGEWVVPCDRCGSGAAGAAGRYWNILGEKNIQRRGLSCEKCGQLINAQHAHAQWASLQEGGIFESYRIPQLMVPWRAWDEIFLDYGRYDRARFYNEVLGISYDSGLRPLTRAQVKDCCKPDITMHPDRLDSYRMLGASQPVFAGIDWGSGEHSYTVLTLGTYVNGRFRIFYVHRFSGEDIEPEPQLSKIEQMLAYFNVRLIGVDYGGGQYPNDHLIRKFGTRRVQRFQYVTRARKRILWNPAYRRWMISRTEVMSDIFNAIKRKQFDFPRWEEFEDPYANDMLNVYSHYNNTLRAMQYDHRLDRPDDTLHSLLYCFFVSMILIPRPDIVAPNRELPHQGPLQTGYRGPVDQG